MERIIKPLLWRKVSEKGEKKKKRSKNTGRPPHLPTSNFYPKTQVNLFSSLLARHPLILNRSVFLLSALFREDPFQKRQHDFGFLRGRLLSPNNTNACPKNQDILKHGFLLPDYVCSCNLWL